MQSRWTIPWPMYAKTLFFRNKIIGIPTILGLRNPVIQKTFQRIYFFLYLSRRSTIEVHTNFSEGPHLKCSIPHPKTDSTAKHQITSRWIVPWPEYSKTSFFETRLLAFRRFWVKKPRHSENSITEMCYLYLSLNASIVERVISAKIVSEWRDSFIQKIVGMPNLVSKNRRTRHFR